MVAHLWGKIKFTKYEQSYSFARLGQSVVKANQRRRHLCLNSIPKEFQLGGLVDCTIDSGYRVRSISNKVWPKTRCLIIMIVWWSGKAVACQNVVSFKTFGIVFPLPLSSPLFECDGASVTEGDNLFLGPTTPTANAACIRAGWNGSIWTLNRCTRGWFLPGEMLFQRQVQVLVEHVVCVEGFGVNLYWSTRGFLGARLL